LAQGLFVFAPDRAPLQSVLAVCCQPTFLMHLCGLVLLTLFLLGTSRRSFRIDDSYYNAQHGSESVTKAFKMTTETRDKLIPGGFGKGLFPRRGQQAGALLARPQLHAHIPQLVPQLRDPHGQPTSVHFRGLGALRPFAPRRATAALSALGPDGQSYDKQRAKQAAMGERTTRLHQPKPGFLRHRSFARSRASPVCSAVGSCDLQSERWPPLRQVLDELPVFTCANEKGQPMVYERDGKPLSIFFADVIRAQQEVNMMSERYPDAGLKLLTAGLGGVFQKVRNGEALLVPSQAALESAGEDWNSETLPLFTCLGMTDSTDSVEKLPFFMDPSDAQASIDRAVAEVRDNLTEAQRARLRLVCTPLSKAVEIIVSGQESDFCRNVSSSVQAFKFMPPMSSMRFIDMAIQELETRSKPRAQVERYIADSQRGTTSGLFPED